MTRIERIDTNRLHFTTVLDKRVTDVGAALAEQRAHLRTAADDIDRGTAERNIADLKAVLERAEANLQAHTVHVAKLDAARTAQRDVSDKRALDARVDQLRRNYLSQTGTTEADFEQALPRLLERQREDAALNASAVFAEQLAETKWRIGPVF